MLLPVSLLCSGIFIMNCTINLLPWFWRIIVTIVDRMSEERLNKAYPCQYCGMSFAQNWLLKRCPSCLDLLCPPSTLSRHWKTHTGDKPFKCSICTRTFSLRDSCVRHLRTVHKELVMHWNCFGCSLPTPLLLSANQSAVAGGLRRCLWLSRGPGWPWRQLRSGTGNRLWARSLSVKYGFEISCTNSVHTILFNMWI